MKNYVTLTLDMWKAIKNLSEPDYHSWRTSAPDHPNDISDALIFKGEVHKSTRRRRVYRSNTAEVFTVMIGQCSWATERQDEVRNNWKELKSKQNVVKWLKAIKTLLHNQLQNECHTRITAYESVSATFRVQQAQHEETAEYCRHFTAATKILQRVGVTFSAMSQGMADEILKRHYRKTRTAATDAQVAKAELKAEESVLAIAILKQACPMRYSEVSHELQNGFLKMMDHYPANITTAYATPTNWHLGSRTRDKTPPLNGVAYSMRD